jgi:hypothetical protein
MTLNQHKAWRTTATVICKVAVRHLKTKSLMAWLPFYGNCSVLEPFNDRNIAYGADFNRWQINILGVRSNLSEVDDTL